MTKTEKKKNSKFAIQIYFRHVFLTLLFALLLLFYPGDGYYAEFFSYNRGLFAATEKITKLKVPPIPYVKNVGSRPIVTAQGSYIIDTESATPVFAKNEHMKFFPASTAKIITALVALDVYKPSKVLTVGHIVNVGQVVGVVPGEKIRVHELLYGLLVHSGNDVAFVLADNYTGGRDAFVTKMNEKAVELGMKNTHFENPAGLDNSNQFTTPFDLSLAGRKLLQNELLSTIVSTPSITISDVDFVHFHQLTNVNKLLGKIAGIGGLKTGYTEEAGENLVTFYKHDGHEFLIVIMKSADRFSDTEMIVNWITQAVGYLTL